MITKEDLARLASLHSDEGIVTVYIKVDPRLAYDRGQPSMKFKGAYSRARRAADQRTIAALEREHDRILQFLDGWEQRGRGLAMFACAPEKIWEVHELGVGVPSYVVCAPEAETRYLARALDEAPRMAVLMLDGGEARLYIGEQGEFRKLAEHREELPSRHAQGGWSQARFQRHVDFHHSRVLRETADELGRMFYEKGFDRLALVGVDGATKEFAGMLAEPLRQRIIGQFGADFKTETDESILERAGALADEEERSAELALVEQIVNYAGAGGKGTLGLEATLLALIEGKADTIVIVDGLTSQGSLCHNCDYFAAAPFKRCPACDSEDCEALPDVVDHAIDFALLKDTHVNIVFGPASELLTSRGGIGALLRFA
jgi:peptide chain release factor subunit 1